MHSYKADPMVRKHGAIGTFYRRPQGPIFVRAKDRDQAFDLIWNQLNREGYEPEVIAPVEVTGPTCSQCAGPLDDTLACLNSDCAAGPE